MVACPYSFPFRNDSAQVGNPRLRSDLGVIYIEAVFLFQETDQFQPVDGGKPQVRHQQGFFADLSGAGPCCLGKQVDQGITGGVAIASSASGAAAS